METALRLVVTNAAAAAVVAVVALVVSRVVRRPALAHALWLLSLVKLLTPPLLPLPLLPAWDPVAALSAPESPTVVRIDAQTSPFSRSAALPSALVASPTAAERPPATHVEATRVPTSLRLQLLAAWVLGLGAVAVLSLAAFRFVRFHRTLAWAAPAPAAIEARAARLAAQLGLRRVPPVLVVPARIPPMLWPEPDGPQLLLPRDLLPELSVPECDALLAHELAHVRRRDHWVRLVEVLATALFWWYPLTWWTRAALRRAEERCCDESVLLVLPRSAEAYANGLLKSLSFVTSAPACVPALASGASPLYELEQRLKEILMSRPAPRLAPPLRLALIALAVLCLAVFPTHARDDEPRPAVAPAQAPMPAPPARAVAPVPAAAPSRVTAPARVAQPAPPASPAQPPAPAQAARSAHDSRRALEAKRRELDARRRSLQQQELELQQQELELNARAEQAELRAAAERLRAEGHARQADLQRRRLMHDAERMAIEAGLDAEARDEEMRQLATKQIEREIKRLEAALAALNSGAAKPQPQP